VAPILAEEAPTVPVWPSSPSAGWASGVDTLWGLPNGEPLVVLPAGAPPPAPLPGAPAGTWAQDAAFAYGFPLSPFLDPFPAADAGTCAVACAARELCVLGNFAGGGCQLVAAPFALAPRPSGNVVVFPPGTALPLPGGIPAVPAPNRAEIHGPYVGGGGWPTVNGHGAPPRAYSPLQPAGLAPCPAQAAGGDPTRAPGEFTSEFGVGQPASFESLSPTLSPPFWGMHGGAHAPDTCSGGFAHTCTGGNVMAQRNYGCDDAWATYFPRNLSLALGDSGAEAFKSQTYLCQLATALQLRALVQQERSRNKFGLLTWQLGESAWRHTAAGAF